MFTFTKYERLASHRLRRLLFARGKSFFVHPLRVTFFCFPEEYSGKLFPPGLSVPSGWVFRYPAKCIIGAATRKFRKAVHRNRVKRLVKEAFRKNKTPFYTFLKENNALCLVAFIVVADSERITSVEMEKSVCKAMQIMQDGIVGGCGLQETGEAG